MFSLSPHGLAMKTICTENHLIPMPGQNDSKRGEKEDILRAFVKRTLVVHALTAFSCRDL